MNLRCLPLAAALVLAATTSGAVAQSTPAAPAIAVTAAPSAPVKGKPAPRALTAAESRETAVAPGELRPELATQRQISIPLGKTPPDSARNPSRTAGTSKPAVDDSAVRCAAMSDENERALCRERIGKTPVKK
jgi:hypothetical protein